MEKVFIVALKGLAPKISRVSYEKDEKDVKLYFTLRNGEIAPENLLIEPAMLPAPLIVENGGPEHKLAKKIAEAGQYLPTSRIFVVFLEKKIFQECGATEKMVPAALKKLRTPDSSMLAMIERNDGNTKGILWSSQKDLREKMLWYGKGKEKGNWVVFEVPRQHLQDAKNKILALL
ncbi:MAG: hypothetical protein HYS52_00830 [Candidatus Wildermuthbacteria bacterium]|nr:hypothetical protein [Candidatus Wildermuthbacteria bacterium]